MFDQQFSLLFFFRVPHKDSLVRVRSFFFLGSFFDLRTRQVWKEPKPRPEINRAIAPRTAKIEITKSATHNFCSRSLIGISFWSSSGSLLVVNSILEKIFKKFCHIHSKLSTFFISKNRFLIIFWVFFTIKVRSKAIKMTEPKIIPTVSEQQQQHDVSKGFSRAIEGEFTKI